MTRASEAIKIVAWVDPEDLCSECKAVRVNVNVGSVCPNGHGKIFPFIDEECSAFRWLRRLPFATLIHEESAYWITGEDGYWKKKSIDVCPAFSPAFSRGSEKIVIAKIGDCPYEFEPINSSR